MGFDADKFLNSTINDPMSTAPLAVPEGEYKAFVDDGDKAITFREGGKSKQGKDLSPQCVVLFAIMDEGVKLALKRDKVLVAMNIWLDVENDQLDLSEGKNVKLGQLRAALGQNSGTWAPLMMKGKGPVMVKVTQRSDPDDPKIKYSEVSRVAAVS